MVMKEESTHQPLLVQVAQKLTQAQQELDELAVQLALGKAEARDAFEHMKKDFRTRISEFRQTPAAETWHRVSDSLRVVLDDLEVRLAVGAANTQELFEEQREKLEEALMRLEQLLEEKFEASVDRENLKHEIEKFRLKLEILKLRFALARFVVKDSFRHGMRDVRDKISSLKSRVQHTFSSGKGRFEDFNDEIKEIYKHLRKAVKSL
jgi:hypothetical protein